MRLSTRKTAWLAAVSIAALGLTAACSSSGSTPSNNSATTSTTGASTAAQGPSTGPAEVPEQTLRVAVGVATPVLDGMDYYWAESQGYYAKHHVKVEIKGYNGDPTALRAVQAGDADYAWIGANIALAAIQAKSPIKIVDAMGPKLEYLVVADKTVPDMKSLDGKTLAISGPGASSEVVPLLMVAAAGGDQSKVKTIAIGGQSARVKALIAGKVNASLIDPTHLSQVKQVAGMHVIGKSAEMLPNYLAGVGIASTSAIKNKAAALADFEAALSETATWAQANPDAAAQAAQQYLKDTPIADLKAATEAYSADHFYNPSGTVSKDAYNYTMQIGITQKQISGSIPYDTAVDTTILAKAKSS